MVKVWSAVLSGAALLLFGGFTLDPRYARWSAFYLLTSTGLIYLSKGFRPNLTAWLAIAYLGWCAVTLTWSPDWRYGLDMFVKTACAVAIFLCVQRLDWDELAEKVCLYALMGAGALWFFPVEHSGFGNPNFLAEFVIAAIPLAVGATFRFKRVHTGFPATVGTLAVGFALLLSTGSNLALIPFAVGWVAALVWMVRRKWWWGAAVYVFATADIALFLELEDVFYSLAARAEIFTASASMFLAHPLGVGLGGFNYHYPVHATTLFRWFEWTTALGTPTVMVGWAHNEILQIATELGIVSLLIAGAFLLALRPHGPAGLSLLAIALCSLVGFPLHNPPTLLIAAVCAGICSRQSPSWSFHWVGSLFNRIAQLRSSRLSN